MEEPREQSTEQEEQASGADQRSTAANVDREEERKLYNSSKATTAEKARIAELEAQLVQSKQEAAENWNKYLRERADWENFRKRQERVVNDRVQNYKKTLMNHLLDVQDNVERALSFQETLEKPDLQQALRMFYWQMSEVMRNEGLTPVPTVGEVFNPYIHEAIETVENSEQPEGTVVEELRKGYTLGSETLRPARVKVNMGNTNK